MYTPPEPAHPMTPEPASPAPKTIFDRNAACYAASPVHRTGPSLAVLLRLADPRPEDVALDVATGTGHTALAVAERAGAVTGVDVSSAMLAQARRLGAERGAAGISFVEGAAEALPFADGAFTLVTARHAPHHFHSAERFLAEVRRVLRPGGRFVLADQVSPTAEDQAWVDRWEKTRDPSHVTQRAPEEWFRLAEAAGLALVASETVHYDLEFAWWTLQASATSDTVNELRRQTREAPAATAGRLGLRFDDAGNPVAHRMPVLVARWDRVG